MWFLIDYDRASGKLVSIREFAEPNRQQAEDERLALELEQRRGGVEREVVLLEAANEQLLRKTHRRYFESWQSIAASA